MSHMLNSSKISTVFKTVVSFTTEGNAQFTVQSLQVLPGQWQSSNGDNVKLASRQE